MDAIESIGFLLAFVLSLSFFLYLGGRVAKYHRNGISTQNSFGHQLLEGAIFSLMGLIVAFTFATANQKMDMRRMLIIDEANAIGTAYLRLDLLSNTNQPIMRQYFRDYLTARLATYKSLPNISRANDEIAKSNNLQSKIWFNAVTECKRSNDKAICMVFLPALNEMFDIANKRNAISNLHPPLVIFYLLVSLAFLSAFLAGYDIKNIGMKRSMIFVISYIIVITVTVYIIIDMEYPRLGLIRIDSFDATISNVLKSFK